MHHSYIPQTTLEYEVYLLRYLSDTFLRVHTLVAKSWRLARQHEKYYFISHTYENLATLAAV